MIDLQTYRELMGPRAAGKSDVEIARHREHMYSYARAIVGEFLAKERVAAGLSPSPYPQRGPTTRKPRKPLAKKTVATKRTDAEMKTAG